MKRVEWRRVLVGLGLLGLIVSGYLAYLHFQKPLVVVGVEYRSRVDRGGNQEFIVVINSKNPIQSAALELNGTSIQLSLARDFGNGTLLYRASFNPSTISPEEGALTGEVVVKDREGNEARYPVSFLANLEAPAIKDLRVEDLGSNIYRVSALIEEPNLKEAYLELPNGSRTPLVKADGRYAANITGKDKRFALKAVDKYDLTSLVQVEVTPRMLFESWLPPSFDRSLSLSLFDSSQLFAEIFESDKMLARDILTLAHANGSRVPKNLAYVVLDQIERDRRVSGSRKTALVREVLLIFLSFGNGIQRLSQIYTLNNATYYFGSGEKLMKEIGNNTLSFCIEKLEENEGINIDFENARVHASLLRLAKRVPSILKYPKEWREGAVQADDLGYKVGIASQNEAKYWDVVERAVKYIVDKLDRGEAEYELNIPDKKIEAWYRRQRLLPIDLFEIDIVSGWHNIIYGEITPSVEIGWRNVMPDSRVGGKTPQQWLEDMAKKDFREKTLRYLLAIDEAVRGHPAYGEWLNSDAAYKKLFGNTVEKDHVIVSFDGLMKEDEVAVFIQGYPRALSRGFIPWRLEAVVPMEEQTCPHYSVLVARVFGRAALVLTDKYPNSRGYHSEPYVIISPQLYEKISQYGKTTLPYAFGWWQYAEPLIKDHVEGKYPLDLQIRRPDGKWERINP
ncbi:MAG: hypothetical protein LM590_04775 [Thermofilum sp.]|nr:hypothetical protein [Thermofilum sp.]